VTSKQVQNNIMNNSNSYVGGTSIDKFDFVLALKDWRNIKFRIIFRIEILK
jgi:hypothetical protein